jgi:hypothetical protein
MRSAVVVALVVSALLLPLQSALAAPVSIDIQVLLGDAELDTGDSVRLQGENVVVHLRRGDKQLAQTASVTVDGRTATCSTMIVINCSSLVQQVDLSDCTSGFTYTITSAPGHDTISSDSGFEGTVSVGRFLVVCRAIS